MKSYCHIYGQLGQTGDRLAGELEHMFNLGLACDTDVDFQQAARHHGHLAELQRRGGLVAPNIYPANLDPACRDSNWWKYSEAECVRLLRIAQERFSTLKLGPLVAVNTYTPGNHFVSACRTLGIRHILGFCAPIVIEDGGWSISHCGSPMSPYFIGDEDYRKPESGLSRRDPVMMLTMELRNPITCLRHWSEGPWGTVNAQAVDRWLEPSGEPLPFLQMAEDWLRQAELTGAPKFFYLNLQYFFAGRCYEHCRRALEWLADQRDKGRLDIGGIRPWEERMRAGGGFIRQITYWRGEMMGFHVGHRPGSVADAIVDESLRRQAIWEYPHATPWRLYDYAKPWSYPAFDPHGEWPASADLSGIALDVVGRQVTVHNDGQPRRIPLALWSVLDGQRAPFTVQATGGAQVEVVPHPTGVGGAVLLESEWSTGETRVELTIRTVGQAANRHRRTWGRLLEAQTFELQHRPYTVLVTQAPDRFTVTARAKADHVRVESLCGMDYADRVAPPAGLPLQFDGTRLACWHRFWDIRADELEIEGVEEVESALRRQTAEVVARVAPQAKAPEPGYQLFGNLREPSRWDRVVGRAAGEMERQRINEWFRRQRPKAGEIMIEAHPGLYLPRGSITKVLGHEFDVIQCADGIGFQELCADYPQGWDWGVAAWVQWRHLRLQMNGLQGRPELFVLHLHAFDPESRDISQRVHFFHPEASAIAPLLGADPGVRRGWEMCVASHWDLPKGLEGRWDSAALCSILIPEECMRWKALGIWICPLEKMSLYDWVAEKGAPGLFSHLWLTKDRI